MLGFLSLVGGDKAGPLASVSAVDHFWRLLPRSDPVAAQQAVTDALARLVGTDDPGQDELRALLALDQRGRQLGDTLLINYPPGKSQARSLERRYWQSACELATSFTHAYERFLRQVREGTAHRSWREHVPLVMLRMLQHREVEALLRPFVAGQGVSTGWTGLHQTYLFAQARGMLHQRLPVRRSHDSRNVETTLEREYLHVLLLELMNGGQLSPCDAFWANWSMPRWTALLTLATANANGEVDTRKDRFYIDPERAEGLVRSTVNSVAHLYLDPAPMLAMIDKEIASLRDSIHVPSGASAFGRGRQLKVLRKLATVFSPKPPRVRRRGERRSVEATVRGVIGLASIVRMLRNVTHTEAVIAEPVVPDVEEITITVFGGFTENSTITARGPVRTGAPGSADDPGVPHEVWQVKDRSASGCRLTGNLADASRVLPGALVAISEEGSPVWSLVVVRRVKRQAGGAMDIGVEYVGQNPRRVKMVALADEGDADAITQAEVTHEPFAALYLAESSRDPVLPIKTLVLPAREYRSHRRLLLGSATGKVTVRVKEPLEEQGDFVWAPYEVIDRSESGQPH